MRGREPSILTLMFARSKRPTCRTISRVPLPLAGRGQGWGSARVVRTLRPKPPFAREPRIRRLSARTLQPYEGESDHARESAAQNLTRCSREDPHPVSPPRKGEGDPT